MKVFVVCLPLVLALQAQDANTLDRFRDQLDRITGNPATDLNDPAARSREALRLPLSADPTRSAAEVQAAQTALIRMNDLLNAQAERAALTRLLNPETPPASPPLGTGIRPRILPPAPKSGAREELAPKPAPPPDQAKTPR
jgi:hypothetical protein